MKLKDPNQIRILLIITLLCTMNCIKIKAQSISYMKKQLELQKLVHKKGNEQFSAGGGLVKNGWNLDVAYSKYLNKDWLFRTDFFYENVKLGLTTLNAYYGSMEYNYCIDKLSNRCFLDAKAGAIIGMEDETNKVMVNIPINTFVYGEKIGFKLEYYITPEVSINLDAEQRFIDNSKIGLLSRTAYVSISYNF